MGALEIGTTWIGLTLDGGVWKMDKDPNDLETVWAGSARRLIPAIRYALSDPGASFPVAANMTWGKSQALGKLAGPAHGCVVTTNGVVVLADGGNKVFAGGKEVTAQSGKVEPPVTAEVDPSLPAAKDATAILAGDFDTDGQLDYMVAGKDGVALWARDEKGQWENSTLETGELGVAAGNPVVALSACDLNGDGRQGVALFHATGSPALFFNRGVGCFGAARTLTFDEANLPAGDGQQTGVVTDLNGDHVPDLLVVDRQGEVWAIYGESKDARKFQLTVEAAQPVVLTVLLGQRVIGMWALRPGEPTVIGLPKAGKVTIRWRTSDGKDATKDVVVTAPSRVRLP